MSFSKSLEIRELIDQKSEDLKKVLDVYLYEHLTKTFVFIIAIATILSGVFIFDLFSFISNVNTIEDKLVLEGLGEINGLFFREMLPIHVENINNSLFYELNTLLNNYMDKANKLAFFIILSYSSLLFVIRKKKKNVLKLKNKHSLHFEDIYMATKIYLTGIVFLVFQIIAFLIDDTKGTEEMISAGLQLEHLSMAANLYSLGAAPFGGVIVAFVLLLIFTINIFLIIRSIEEKKKYNNDSANKIKSLNVENETAEISKLEFLYQKNIAKTLNSDDEKEKAVAYFAEKEDSKGQLSISENKIYSDIKNKLEKRDRSKEPELSYFQKQREILKNKKQNILNI